MVSSPLFEIFLVVIASVVLETTNASNRYVVYDYKSNVKTWRKAREFCERIGKSLVKIDNGIKDEILQRLLSTKCHDRETEGWFIGGYAVNGKWKWSDGTSMTYDNFPPGTLLSGHGSHRKVYNYAFVHNGIKAYTGWGYISSRSSNKLGFICEDTTCSG